MSRTRDHSKNALGWYVECNLEYIKTKKIYVPIPKEGISQPTKAKGANEMNIKVSEIHSLSFKKVYSDIIRYWYY